MVMFIKLHTPEEKIVPFTYRNQYVGGQARENGIKTPILHIFDSLADS